MRQGDIVHVEATVEVYGGHEVVVVVKAANGEQRVRVAKSLIKHHAPGPLKSGDRVTKPLKGKGKLEGVVEHRLGDHAWITWGDDLHSIEPVEGLTRI